MLKISLRGATPHVVRPLRGLRLLAACAALAAPIAGHAAQPTSLDTPDVVGPFQDYQRWQETPLADWREANERVREIGGWRTYMRESQQEGETAGAHHDH
jgi:hypothetical protein